MNPSNSKTNSKKQPSLCILGRGYVGSRLLEAFPEAKWTRRDTFELGDPSSWKSIRNSLSSSDTVVWTFPAASNENEEELALQFFDQFLHSRQVILLGTTSSYLVPEKDTWIDENSDLDLTQVRTRTEEKLRKKGACILHLAGIFGPQRNPLDWYLKGYIRSGLSYLNLIHVQNITDILKQLILQDYPSPVDLAQQRFNLSNGQPKTHNQLLEELKALKLLPSQYTLPQIEAPQSKRVSSKKIQSLLSLEDSFFYHFP